MRGHQVMTTIGPKLNTKYIQYNNKPLQFERINNTSTFKLLRNSQNKSRMQAFNKNICVIYMYKVEGGPLVKVCVIYAYWEMIRYEAHEKSVATLS